MAYYLKQGQSSIFHKIKIAGNECEINIKSIEKAVKKIKKKSITPIILSKNLKENLKLIETLNNFDITILDGKWLMQYLLQEIIDYIQEKNLDEISILVNNLTEEVKQSIIELSSKYKRIRIVTNHPEKFKRIEKELYEQKGIAIILTNNKKRAISKSKLIVNFDFVQETINEYNIEENAIIINLGEKVKINKKRFSGTIITDYEVEFSEINENIELDLKDTLNRTNYFSLKEMIEEKVYQSASKSLNLNTYRTVKEILNQYNIKIKELYGMNGKIQ